MHLSSAFDASVSYDQIPPLLPDRNRNVNMYSEEIINLSMFSITSPLWSTSQSSTGPEVRVRFLALPDVLRSSGAGTGSTQPREYNWGAT
jgi:hypothetical protein